MAPVTTENPFVGLRPFESDDSLYYFGRNEQTRALLEQLHANRFLAVVGASGSGKSSLVRAGLIPILESGFLVQDRDSWQVATMKPGAAPLGNLAEAMLRVLGESEAAKLSDAFEEEIRTGGVSTILKGIHGALDSQQNNLLLLVDQFEELFRFADTPEGREEAADFVNILLRLAGQSEAKIYVVLTMRSDFIGDCDRFQGLPEAMNRSQYLVPRLTRKQRREAIAGPIRLSRSKITPRLLDKLLNENLDTRDDLPILQHALMRTWDNWNTSGREGEIDLAHYEAVGGVAEALNNHADEALGDLGEEDRLLARQLFETLTETDAGNRKIRRPAFLSEISAVTGAPPERLLEVIETFRKQGRSFLVLARKPGRDDLLADISHESLIRQWDRLRGWVEEEAEAAKTYRRLAETAELHERGRAGLYHGIDLELALEWQTESCPTREWGLRYHPGYDTALEFLEKSRRDHEEALAQVSRLRKRRLLTALSSAVTAIVILSVIAISSVKKKRIAQRAEQDANYGAVRAIQSESGPAFGEMDVAGVATEDYQKAWLSALVPLSEEFLQKLPPGAVLPESLGRLCRWDLLAGAMPNIWTSPEADDPLLCTRFSPDGNYFVSGSENGVLTLWHYPGGDDPPNKIKDAFAQAPKNKVWTMAFSPDGKILATGSGRDIQFWDFSKPEKPTLDSTLPGPTKEEDKDADVRGLAFNPKKKMTLAAGAEDGVIRLWNLSDLSNPVEMDSPGNHNGEKVNVVFTVAFNPAGDLLASGSEDKTIRLWDVSGVETPDPVRILEGHQDSVGSLAFHPRHPLLCSAGRENAIRLWDISKAASPVQLDSIQNAHTNSIHNLVISADGKSIASASYDKSIGLWDLEDPTAPKLRSRFEGHIDTVYGAAFSPDGKTLLSASKDKTLRLWDLTDPSRLQKATGHTHYVNSIAVTADGKTLASGSRDNTVRIWKLAGQALPEQVAELPHDDYVYAVAISPDGKTLATGSRDHKIRLYSLADLTESPDILYLDQSGNPVHTSWVLSLSFSADSELLASGSYTDHRLAVWDVAASRKVRHLKTIDDFKDTVRPVIFSPKDRILAVGSYDKTVRLYKLTNAAAPDEVYRSGELPGQVSSLGFRPDGKVLAVGLGLPDRNVQLWDIDNPGSPQELAQFKAHSDRVTSIAFSSNAKGSTMATSSTDEDKTIRLWDLTDPKTPTELAVLRGHTDTITSVVFGRDGANLYSGSRDHSIRVWKLAGPFEAYRREGADAPTFKRLYRRSFELLPYSWEFRTGRIYLDPKDSSSAEIPPHFHYRPPGTDPVKWIEESAPE